jgi:transposase InsO family protein
VSPERKQRTVETVRRRLGPEKASERRVCRVLGQPRATQRYESKRAEQDKAFLAEMRAIAAKRLCWGSPQVYEALRRRGLEVNHKRVERLWREHGMQVPKKRQKRGRVSLGGSENSCVRKRPEHPNHIGSYDFGTDYTERGRQLRMLCVLDEFTGESLAIEVQRSFTARQVLDVLGYLFAVRGAPEHIRSDNGPGFVAQSVRRWLGRASAKTLYVAKSSPWENGPFSLQRGESFNSRFRQELLDRELFLGLEDARWCVDRWRLDYNHHRPHSSLGYQTRRSSPPAAPLPLRRPLRLRLSSLLRSSRAAALPNP